MIRVAVDAGRYVAICRFEERHQPKGAGFRWDPAKKQWWTQDPKKAQLLGYRPDQQPLIIAPPAPQARIHQESIEASRASDSDLDIPVPQGKQYLPYQKAGIAYAMTRSGALIGDDMGLGKTIQAIGIMNVDATIRSVLVCCPASLKINWQREIVSWSVKPRRIGIAEEIWPWGFDVVIVNYDRLTKFRSQVEGKEWDLLILDEAHYLKNEQSKRTKLVCGSNKRGQEQFKGISAKRKVALTGTPIPNKPVELWPLVHYLDPKHFPSKHLFTSEFCGATENGYGRNENGASNLDRLQAKLRTAVMVRRRKIDVLKQLPAKRRQVIELDDVAGTVGAEKAAWIACEASIEKLKIVVELAKAEAEWDYRAAVAALRTAVADAFAQMSELREQTALAKIPQVIAHIQQALSEPGKKLIVFAHHRSVIAKIRESLAAESIESLVITGETPVPLRQGIVDEFQKNDSYRVFVGNIQAAGVGLTLTRSDHVIFVELDWVPGNMTQAEDRAHRIGQINSVLVQHLVIDGSIDSRMAKRLIDKQAIIDAALDDEKADASAESVTPMRDQAATENVTRQQIAKEAARLSRDQIAEIQRTIRVLAGDQAVTGIASNKLDHGVASALASKAILTGAQAALSARVIKKYQWQIDESRHP